MPKDKEPTPGSAARAKRIHEQIDQLRKKRSDGAPIAEESSPAGREGTTPRSLRDVIHDRMEKLDKNEKNKMRTASAPGRLSAGALSQARNRFKMSELAVSFDAVELAPLAVPGPRS